MEATNYKELPVTKILSFALVGLGVYVAVKNHKRDGFWSGVGASLLVFGISIHAYDKSKK